MRSSKIISVVIPTHNRYSGLMAALDSVFSQEALPLEVIVIDDGSEPPVPRSIFDQAPPGVNCVLERFDSPKGANQARNRGITLASGLYIAFLDDDDRFHPEKLSSVGATIEAHPIADVIYHPAIIRMVAESIEYTSSLRPFSSPESAFSELLVMNRIGGTSMVVCRRELLITVGMFNPDQPALQDYELWLRLAKAGASFILIKKPLTFYYQATNKSSISKSIVSNRLAIKMIEDRYSDDYSAMNKSDKKNHEIWKRRMLIHKALLNKRIFFAVKEQIKVVFLLPTVSNFLSLIAICAGTTVVYRLKSRFSK